VERETPVGYLRFPKIQPRNRLSFVKWLVSPDHPLSARVTINRIWQDVFGIGIVELGQFRTSGQTAHPQLLDWLARDFL
jgi:hypothetical protein